jgi:exopolysaccharide biosynthesis polyprenyl glycosylphosphotransferase
MSDIARKGQSTRHRNRFRLVSVLWLLLGAAVGYGAGALLQWSSIAPLVSGAHSTTVVVTFVSFVVLAMVVRYIRRFALVNLWATVFLLWLLAFALNVVVLMALDVELPLLFSVGFYLAALVTVGIWIRIIKKVQYLRLMVVPAGITDEVVAANHEQLALTVLDGPEEPGPHQANGSRQQAAVGVREYDGVVVDTREAVSEPWVRFLTRCRLEGLRIYEAGDLFEAVSGRVSVRHFSRGMVENISASPFYRFGKRVLDVVGVIVTLPVTLLLMVATAAAVRIETPGAVLFTQTRIGEHGRPFTIVKFRSMVTDSERHGPKFAAAGDARVTRVGAFIRRFRLDELPQIWNILKGEMSWIGPRPEQPAFVEQFSRAIPYYAYRHTVKPGITGWAQVNQGYAADEESTRDKLEFDLYYIKHFSFWLDLLIVFKTLKTILTGFGAR